MSVTKIVATNFSRDLPQANRSYTPQRKNRYCMMLRCISPLMAQSGQTDLSRRMVAIGGIADNGGDLARDRFVRL